MDGSVGSRVGRVLRKTGLGGGLSQGASAAQTIQQACTSTVQASKTQSQFTIHLASEFPSPQGEADSDLSLLITLILIFLPTPTLILTKSLCAPV